MICEAYRGIEARKEAESKPPFTMTEQQVTDANRCEGCHFDKDVMAEHFMCCGFSCQNCPWKDVRPIAMLMISETAAMSDEEMQAQGIQADIIYNERKGGSRSSTSSNE